MVTPAPANIIAEIYKDVKFAEIFAGAAELTRVLSASGVPVPPLTSTSWGERTSGTHRRWRL